MIRLESAHIEEIRGVRKLDIDSTQKSFTIFGPNGTGKSGVIKAIEFGLTGLIARLTRKGTKKESGSVWTSQTIPDTFNVVLTTPRTLLGLRR